MELAEMELINFLSHRIVFILLTTAVRGTLLIGVVYLFFVFAKGMTSKARHIIWFLTILSFIILPVLSKLLEPVQIAVLPTPFETSGHHQTIFLQPAFETGRTEEARSAVTTAYQMNGKFFGLQIGSVFTILTACWITGLVIFSSRFIYGFRRIRKIFRSGTALHIEKDSVLIKQKRNIRVYSSAAIAGPFTFGIFHPVVMVPEQMASWSVHRLEPILIHELFHIRKLDFLTQTVSKIICCVFWPLPFIWLALRNLRLEQEKACDEAVVLDGSNPRMYARQLLNMARSMTGGVLFTGLFIVNDRTRMLEKRIKNIFIKRGKKMKKTHWFFVVLAYVIILSLLAGCGASDDSTVSKRSAEKTKTLRSPMDRVAIRR